MLCAGCTSSNARPWFEFSGRDAAAGEQASRKAAVRLEAVFGGVCRDPLAEARIERLASQLAKDDPELPQHYHGRLLDSEQLNAASLPGGRLYITRAFYAQLETDEHLAAVIAHELAHLAARDHTRGRCKSRAHALEREMAADLGGIAYLCRAGYSRAAMGEVIALIGEELPVDWKDARLAEAVQVAMALPSREERQSLHH